MKMNSTEPPQDDDATIDRLLARTYRDTSPEFEARWVALRRELRQAPTRAASPRDRWRTALLWLSPLGIAVALTWIMWLPRAVAPVPAGPDLSPALAELFAMDAALGRAAPLLVEDNRLVLLNLPATVPPQP